EALLRAEHGQGADFRARLYKYRNTLVINREEEEGKRFLITDAATAQGIADDIKSKDIFLSSIEKKLRKRPPAPPFITSTIQQEASRRLKFPVKRTMMLAQQLYEGVELGKEGSAGLITYMRTDSFRIAPEAQEWARELIIKNFGNEYVP